MQDVLLVAATDRELDGRDGLVCGIGPVEAAVATARALALRDWQAVLHIGVAGGRGLAAGTARDRHRRPSIATSRRLSALVDRVESDPRLVATARSVLPGAPALPIGTSAAVGRGGRELVVEAMEGFGVLRAAALAGVPAVEVRTISNEIGEPDRGRWHVGDAIDALSGVTPRLLEAIREARRD